MSHSRTYAPPENPAIPFDTSLAGSCASARNGAGTCGEKWHKIGTKSSRDVPPEKLKTEEKKESSGALAGATGADGKNTLGEKDTLKRLQAATALACAVAACDPEDRLPFLERLLEELCPGWPQVPFLCGLMEEAAFWADRASRVELKAYALACYQRMTPHDQAAFLSYVQQREAA